MRKRITIQSKADYNENTKSHKSSSKSHHQHAFVALQSQTHVVVEFDLSGGNSLETSEVVKKMTTFRMRSISTKTMHQLLKMMWHTADTMYNNSQHLAAIAKQQNQSLLTCWTSQDTSPSTSPPPPRYTSPDCRTSSCWERTRLY